MENPRSQEEKIIKDIRNLFRLEKEQNYSAVKDIRNLFRQEKETKAIKNILRYKKEEENCFKSVRVNHFWSKNYIEYRSNGDKNRMLSVEEYRNKIRPYLRDIINDLKQSVISKIQLTTLNNFISS